MNRNFGKLTSGAITYAPSVLNGETGLITRPTAAKYLAAGYKAVNAAAPTEPAPSGSHYEPDGWAEDATTITRKWKTVADPVIPRKFSKLKIYAAISGLDTAEQRAAGTSAPTVDSAATWAKVQTWLEGKSVNGMNGWLAFQLAQEISEDHPLFAAWSEEARVLLGLTPEQFETLLNACILEG